MSDTRHAWKLPAEVTVEEITDAWDFMSEYKGRDYTVHYGSCPCCLDSVSARNLVSDAHYTRAIDARRAAKP